MADLDLTEAIEAGASAINIGVTGSVLGGSVDDFKRLLADPAIRAAAPLIVAQVRAQIAADIEEAAEKRSAEAGEHRSIAHRYRDAGEKASSLIAERHMRTAVAFRNQSDGMSQAAEIARGDL